MGIWDIIRSATDILKLNPPSLYPIKNASVSYGSAAISTIDNTVRVNGLQRLNDYIPDVDRRAQIGSFATKFAKNAAVYSLKEGYKLIPGGEAVAKIVSETAREMKAENDYDDPEKKAKVVSVTARKMKAENEDAPKKRALTGKIHVYRAAKEGLMDQPSCQSSSSDKMQDMNAAKTEDGGTKELIISQYNNRMEPLKENSDEHVISPVPQETGGRRISIRSKL